MGNMQELILAQYAKCATLFGIQFLQEIKKTHPEWLGNEFRISEEVVNLIEEKCMEDLEKIFEKESDIQYFTKATSSTEGLYSELVCIGRSTTMDLIDPLGVTQNPRFKVVEKVLVLI